MDRLCWSLFHCCIERCVKVFIPKDLVLAFVRLKSPKELLLVPMWWQIFSNFRVCKVSEGIFRTLTRSKNFNIWRLRKIVFEAARGSLKVMSLRAAFWSVRIQCVIIVFTQTPNLTSITNMRSKNGMILINAFSGIIMTKPRKSSITPRNLLATTETWVFQSRWTPRYLTLVLG